MDDFIFIPCLHLYFTLYYFNSSKEREIFSRFNLSCLLVELISSRLEMFIQCKSSDILHQHPSIALNKKIRFINFLKQAKEMLLWHSKCIYISPLEKCQGLIWGPGTANFMFQSYHLCDSFSSFDKCGLNNNQMNAQASTMYFSKDLYYKENLKILCFETI